MIDASAQPVRHGIPWATIALIAVGVLIIAAALWIFFDFLMGAMRGSEPYRHGLSAAQSNPQVVAALGEPIEAGLFFEGNISVSDRTGEARFAIPIHGPKSSGTLLIGAQRESGPWSYATLDVRLSDGRRIALESPHP